MSDLRFPIGKLEIPDSSSPTERRQWIENIVEAPASLRKAVAGLTPEQLDTPYRPEGWTVRQVAHHLPESHMNSYIRFKLALTEDSPTIKPYDEAAWAELADAKESEIEPSLLLLEALHQRWTRLLEDLTAEEFEKGFQHPELGSIRLDQNCAIYSWHGKHHVAHITSLRERNGW